MALLLIKNDHNYDSWLKALHSDAPFEVFTPETVQDKADIKMALTWKAPAGSFDIYPNLEVVGSMGAGVDHLFADPSLPKNVALTRVVDEKLSGDMQEFVLALCLNQLKNIHHYANLQRSANWEPTPYRRVADVIIGILGFGTLGQAVGKKLKEVGFQVSGWSKSRKEVEGINSFSENELPEFLSTCAILVCLLPLTAATDGILNTVLFQQLPKGAYLINVARGGHLKESDVLAALDSGQLSGAALDVFNTEPLPIDHPVWKRAEIIITPHVASMSNAASVAPQVIENYRRMERGEELLNRVSREKNY